MTRRTRLSRVTHHLVLSAYTAAQACPDDEEAAAISRYITVGASHARSLGNRGPIRFGTDGKIAQDIINSYYKHGFYVLEGAVKAPELAALTEEFEALLDNAPHGGDKPWKSLIDRYGRQVQRPGAYGFGRPLSDPQGGTGFGVYDFKKGVLGQPRHPMKMREPTPVDGAPAAIVQNIVHPLLHLDSAVS